jgi:general secretion pathway protein D
MRRQRQARSDACARGAGNPRACAWLALAVALPLVLAACATPSAPQRVSRAAPMDSTQAVTDSKPAGEAGDGTRVFKGTGVLVKGQQPGGGVPPAPAVQPSGAGGVVLNFEGADLREVVRNVLGEILNEAYTIDPGVGGQVTIRTTSGIPREALPATLEMLLRSNGATMVKEAGIYKIMPSAAAVRGNVTPQLGSSQRPLPPGFSVQIVPLRYVGVRDMLRIVEPFAKDAQAVRADELRNLLILAGTERELRHLLETIEMFDIDWMAGMSAGVFTLQNSDVKSVMQELDKVTGGAQQSPLAGILRIIPIERMNALLVITPQPAYLEQAKLWIERLDRGGGGEGPRLFVYNPQYSRAEKIAPLLQQAFTGRVQQQQAAAPPTIAPGTPPGTIVNAPTFTPTNPLQPQPTQVQVTPAPQTQTQAGAQGARGAQDGAGIVRNLVAVADKDNNVIIIVATSAEYTIIEQALRKLDVPQRQVVMEVTIAEVTLTDNLQFGVEWLFKGAAPSGRGFGGNVTSPVSSTTGGVANAISGALVQGFSYLISNAAFPGGIQAALRLLDTYGDTKVVANPHLAALDNQKATIKVGDKIPICQQTFVGGTTNGTVTTASQYIDTGVLLQVTPHINAGGLVTLDVQAEVSIAGATQNVCDPPPINTRSVQTLLSVPSGQTMVMGGLINDAKGNTSSGLPLLSRVPVIGGLFGNQELKSNRTELVLFITPRVIESEFDLRAVIDDLRRRMEYLDRGFPAGTVPGNVQGGAGSVAPR